MGLRFRKSIKIAPGVKLNFGKKSIGMSVGGRRAGISINSKTGVHGRVSAPGTGFSYTTKLGGEKKKRRSIENNHYTSAGNNNKKDHNEKWYTKTWWIIFFLIIFPPIGIFLMWNYKKDSWSKKRKIVLTTIFTIYFIVGVSVGDDSQQNTSTTEANNQTTISTSQAETEELTTEEQTDEEETTIEETTIEETIPVIATTQTPTSEYVEQVWINESGKKYHKTSDCSGMEGAYQVTKDQAIKIGKEPCKKCY